MDFTYDDYRNLIETALNNGYKICSYDRVEQFQKLLILRHDIDFSPMKALSIAGIEQEYGIQSTYFVLLTSGFYNVFSKKTADIIHNILDMGHDVGLHFDERRYEVSSVEQMKDHIQRESKLLESALDRTIKVVSMHRPTRITIESDLALNGLINSYSHKFFKEMKYVSDSRMCWREKVLDIIASNEHPKLHILTHPFWYSAESEGIQSKLLELIHSSKHDTFMNLKENFRDIEEFVDESTLLD